MNIFDYQIERTATVRRAGLALFFVLLAPRVMAQSPQSTMQDPPKAESNNKLDNCLRRVYSKVDDRVHTSAVGFGSGKAMAEGVPHFE